MRKPPILARLLTAALVAIILASGYGAACKAITARGSLTTAAPAPSSP